MNLVSNSLKYTNFGTIDTLIESYENKKICKGKKMIKISVSDTGMGMSKEQQKNLFNEFYTSDKDTNSYGVGIGLCVC